MGKKSCLDTGVISLFYSKNFSNSIIKLFRDIKEKKIEAHIVSPVMSEVFYHICNLNGKVAAETTIATFLNTYSIKLLNLNQTLIIKAGTLKCQHYQSLSYNDCFSIVYALNKKLIFHTTEKELGKIIPNLKLKSYII
jgi:predicted nucleic acid-binding protein